MSIEANGHDITYVEPPDQVQKNKYLDLVWQMSKEHMFKELMRVHAESTRLLTEAQIEIDTLRMTIAKLDKSIQ